MAVLPGLATTSVVVCPTTKETPMRISMIILSLVAVACFGDTKPLPKECTQDADCGLLFPYCQVDLGTCVECLTDDHCVTEAVPNCVASVGGVLGCGKRDAAV